MDSTLKAFLTESSSRIHTLGIIGFGASGQEIQAYAKQLGISAVLLCDPIAALEEADELGDAFFALWGNGMGGCTLTGEDLETFLPLERLISAQTIIITEDADAHPEFKGLVTADFLKQCPSKTSVFCLAKHRDVIDEDALDFHPVQFL